MEEYPVKILMAFAETFSEKDGKFYQWLLENGYPELAALSSSVRGSNAALNWLMENKYFHLAAFDDAIDNNKSAYDWLIKNGYPILAITAEAVNDKESAKVFLEKNELDVFLYIAKNIRNYLTNGYFDSIIKPFK